MSLSGSLAAGPAPTKKKSHTPRRAQAGERFLLRLDFKRGWPTTDHSLPVTLPATASRRPRSPFPHFTRLPSLPHARTSSRPHFLRCLCLLSPPSVATPPHPTPAFLFPQGESRLQQCQKEAEEVTEIMMDNYSKVMDREGKLSELDERADELRNQSVAFSKTTKTVAQKKRWENMKYKIILGGVAAGVVLLLILVIVLSLTLPGSGSQAESAQSPTGGN
nr:vesicle-associated membrane protein 5 [Pogona vitticeps]